MIRKLLFFIFISISSVCYGQEICDNGVDDDGDGLIDLNDEECECSRLLPSSLIPNPSFEDHTCCPTMNARLDCAVGWIQASNPTTDYIHTCMHYLGNTSIPATAPLPLPDGEGAVGFRDGQKNVGANYKEYVGACLTESMQVGVSYSLDFFVGFRDNVPGSMEVEIAIFGSEFCNELPFGHGSNSIGCPSNTGVYDEIDNQIVSGSNEWVRVTFDFVPTKPYEVFIIGPGCQANPNYLTDPYFYVDGLTLAETSKFGIPFKDVSGSICNDDLVLSIEDLPGRTYQWYKNGIALIGEVNPKLSLIASPDVEGDYLVIITVPDGCISSKSYNVRVPPYYADQAAIICESEEHIIGATSFTEEGIHEITIEAQDGCDSIITLSLDIMPNTSSFFEDIFCEGDTYVFLDIKSNEPGTYHTIIANENGCDSTITLDLIEIPKTDGIELVSKIDVVLGDSINIIPSNYDTKLIDFFWHDADGTVIANSPNLFGFKPLDDALFSLVGSDEFGCMEEAQIAIRVDKSSITLHMPNIFTPDNNNINDYFSFVPTNAVQSVESFVIYDRWGNIMFQDSPVNSISNYLGWDGRYNGNEAVQGVYGYIIHATFIDGSKKVFAGNLTLIRM